MWSMSTIKTKEESVRDLTSIRLRMMSFHPKLRSKKREKLAIVVADVGSPAFKVQCRLQRCILEAAPQS
jgi:hypothetical protein